MASVATSRDRASAAAAGWTNLRAPLWILAALAVITAIDVGRSFLLPLMASLLVALVLSGTVEWLHRIRVPRIAGAAVLLLLMAGAIGGIGQLVWAPAQEWLQSAPRVLRTIETRVRPAQAVIERISQLATRATSFGGPSSRSAMTPVSPPEGTPATAAHVVAETGWIAAGIATSFALTLFLLAAGPPALARMTAIFASDLHAVQILRILDAIRVDVGRYYRTLALINGGLGVATAVAMWQLGMPSPILWGVLACVLNFIPYLGSATTLVILTLVALVTFETIPQVLMVSLTYLGLAAVEGQIVQPVLLGRRLDLNPIVVVLALWGGAWMWGFAGVVFALPVLVATKVAASQYNGGGALSRFLSPFDAAPPRRSRHPLPPAPAPAPARGR